MSVVGCGCLVSLSLVAVSSWLSNVGCWVWAGDCLVSLSLVVVSSWLSGLGCRLLVVDAWSVIIYC
jgi:hypothetical protein